MYWTKHKRADTELASHVSNRKIWLHSLKKPRAYNLISVPRELISFIKLKHFKYKKGSHRLFIFCLICFNSMAHQNSISSIQKIKMTVSAPILLVLELQILLQPSSYRSRQAQPCQYASIAPSHQQTAKIGKFLDIIPAVTTNIVTEERV